MKLPNQNCIRIRRWRIGKWFVDLIPRQPSIIKFVVGRRHITLYWKRSYVVVGCI